MTFASIEIATGQYDIPLFLLKEVSACPCLALHDMRCEHRLLQGGPWMKDGVRFYCGKVLLFVTAWMAAAAPAVHAQAAAPPSDSSRTGAAKLLEFEVATIKPLTLGMAGRSGPTHTPAAGSRSVFPV